MVNYRKVRIFYHEILRDYSPDEEMKTKLQKDPNVFSYSVCLKSSRSHEESFWDRLAQSCIAKSGVYIIKYGVAGSATWGVFTKRDMGSFRVILQQRSRL